MGVLDDAIREHLDLKRRRGADPTEIERLEREALGPVRREPTAYTEAGEDPHLFHDEDVIADAVAPGPPEGGHLELESVEPADQTSLLDPAAIDLETGSGADAGSGRPAIAAPDYDHPDLDEFTAAVAPGTSAMEPEPAAPVLHPDPETSAGFDAPAGPEEPRQRRRGLFSRFSHSHETQDETSFAPIHEDDEDDPFAEPDLEPAERLPAMDETQVLPPASAPGTPPPALKIQPEAPEPGHTVEYDVERHFAEEDAAVEAPAAAEEDEDILEETPDFLADTPDHDRLWFEQKPPPDFDFER